MSTHVGFTVYGTTVGELRQQANEVLDALDRRDQGWDVDYTVEPYMQDVAGHISMWQARVTAKPHGDR